MFERASNGCFGVRVMFRSVSLSSRRVIASQRARSACRLHLLLYKPVAEKSTNFATALNDLAAFPAETPAALPIITAA